MTHFRHRLGSILSFLLDFLRQFGEAFMNILPILRADFKKLHMMLFCQDAAFFNGDLSLLFEIAFGANEDFDDPLCRIVLDLFDPGSDVVIRAVVGD
jgi:hypothetical protein